MSDETITPPQPAAAPAVPPVTPPAPQKPAEIKPEDMPITRNASWGAIISIVVILIMIVVGAFYSWGQRVAQQHPDAVQTR